MKRYVIDANALISFVTDRNPRLQQKIAPLFESAAQLKAAILYHQHVLTEFIYVMDRVYGVPKDKINSMVTDLMEMPGMEIIQEIDFISVLSCWPNTIHDFGDAVIASVGISRRSASIVTFDRKFANKLELLGLKIHSFE